MMRRTASVALMLVSLAGCRPGVPTDTAPAAAPDRSIVVAGTTSFGIENGTAYDKASLDIDAYKKLVIPDDARVSRTSPGGRVGIFMAKTLHFFGGPPAARSIRETRKHLGCATKADGTSLLVATFGEWNSKEGGASMTLLLVVPAGIAIERRATLSGEQSIGFDHGYGSAGPLDGWTAVAAVPDPEQTAKK